MTQKLTVDPGFEIEHLRKGKRLYGAFVTYPDGRRVYLAYRKHGEIFRAGKKSISRAIQEGVAGWAIDSETLGEVRARGVDAIGVLVKETGDKYLTNIQNYYDPYRSSVIDYSGKGGSLQRVLPLQFFRKADGKIKL